MPAERAQLLELAERVEQAEGACRELDSAIYIAVHIPAERAGRIDQSAGLVGWWPRGGGYVSAVEVPAFTSSLDAALTLYDEVPTLIHSNPRWVVRDALRALAAQHPEEGSSDAG